MSKNVLTEEQLSSVHAHILDRYKQNTALLDALCLQTEVKPFEDFLDALRDTHQSHLVYYIKNEFEGINMNIKV